MALCAATPPPSSVGLSADSWQLYFRNVFSFYVCSAAELGTEHAAMETGGGEMGGSCWQWCDVTSRGEKNEVTLLSWPGGHFLNIFPLPLL